MFFLYENLSKSDLNKIKSLIRKEINKELDNKFSKKKEDELRKLIKQFIDKDDINLNKKIEEIIHEFILSYHEIFYKDKNLIKNRIKLR